MANLLFPKSRGWKTVLLVVRLYLVVFLVGCSSAPPPCIEEIRAMQTREVDAGYDDVATASLRVLQDLGFTVEESDTDAGVITAQRQTTARIGDLTKDKDPDDDGLPTWATVLLIATGVVIIVAVIAIIAGGDDDDEPEVKQEHHTPTFVETHTDEDEGIEHYNYRLTINLERLDDATTGMRVSMQGNRKKGDAVLETGAVYDRQFYEDFYYRLEDALPAVPTGG
jgi:hypothetical protein